MMSPASINARDESELRIWLEDWGFEASLPLAQVNQVHGTTVAEASESAMADADGLWSDREGIILSVKAADCAPVWIADMPSQHFAIMHAGWRGVAAGIIASAIDTLTERGCVAEELAVAVGPHLRPCCFEVGPEVAERFEGIEGAVLPASRLSIERQRDDSRVLDLAAAICADLNDLGVREEQIFVATTCTRCNPDLFHSYRRNGSGGPLMAAVAARRG